MKISVLCSKKRTGFNIGSKVIMLVEQLPFSHVAYLYESGGEKFVSESVYPFSRTIPLSLWINDYETVTIFDVELQCDQFKFYEINRGLDGREYSVFQILAIGMERLGRLAYRVFNRVKINGRKALICTERLALVLERTGTFKFSSSLDTLSLRELYKALYRIEKYGQNAEDCYNKILRAK